MGIWGFIKSLFGFKEEDSLPVYDPPHIVIPGAQNQSQHWDQLRNKWDKRMKWERIKRSRYGG